MRFICTISTDKTKENPLEFSYYLAQQGIENASEEMNPTTFHIWVYDEDQVQKAQLLYEEYRKHPGDPCFRVHEKIPLSLISEEEDSIDEEISEEAPVAVKRRKLASAPYGIITISILLAAIVIFFWTQSQKKATLAPKIPGVIQAPVVGPLEQSLLYDYPYYLTLRDQLLALYPSQDSEVVVPSKEAQIVIQELKNTPVWMGLYDQFLKHHKHPDIPFSYQGPLFEKIQQLEIWRFFSPALLHFDLLHIFFNILWFIILGNQIEFRLGKGRYLLLLLLASLVSNTAQYLMSGPFFMGLSGIICAMAAFIYARQQVAPWEGYLLHRVTLLFLALFIVGMFFLQTTFFFLQFFGKFEFTIGIANTAHLTGALTGYLLGRQRLFRVRSQ